MTDPSSTVAGAAVVFAATDMAGVTIADGAENTAVHVPVFRPPRPVELDRPADTPGWCGWWSGPDTGWCR